MMNIDVNDKEKINVFFNYLDLLEKTTVNKFLNKVKDFDASYLSFKALESHYKNKHYDKKGLDGLELAQYVKKLDSHTLITSYY